MAKKNVNLWMIIAFVLAVLLLSTVVYICVSKYREFRDKEKADIFNLGAQYGYQSAVENIFASSRNCNPVNISIGNETIQFIDVSCVSWR